MNEFQISKDEYDKSAKAGLKFFAIFHFEDEKNGTDPVKDLLFMAESTEKANERFKDWTKTANPSIKYYLDRLNVFYPTKDGNYQVSGFIVGRDSPIDEDPSEDLEEDEPWYVRRDAATAKFMADLKNFLENYDSGFTRTEMDRKNGVDPNNEVDFRKRNLLYALNHLENGEFYRLHLMSDVWNLDSHVVSDLIFNIRRLKKEHHGVPNTYVAEAAAEYGVDPINLGEKQHEILELASSKYEAALDSLLEKIAIYEFFEDPFEFFDGLKEKKSDILGFDLKLAKKVTNEHMGEIPYCMNEYRQIDYAKLYPLIEKAWNDIWIEWAKIGRDCWD